MRRSKYYRVLRSSARVLRSSARVQRSSDRVWRNLVRVRCSALRVRPRVRGSKVRHRSDGYGVAKFRARGSSETCASAYGMAGPGSNLDLASRRRSFYSVY